MKDELSSVVHDRIMKLPKANIVNLMMTSLRILQNDKRRSSRRCVMLAMGADEVDDGNFLMPPLKIVKRYTCGAPLPGQMGIPGVVEDIPLKKR